MKFDTGDRIIVTSGKFANEPGTIQTVYAALNEYHVSLDSHKWLLTYKDDSLKPEDPFLFSHKKGERYMMPNGELVNPDKIFVKGRSKK